MTEVGMRLAAINFSAHCVCQSKPESGDLYAAHLF
jgi:hypothetical protein